MVRDTLPAGGSTPGISWEPGDEDYPFPAVAGETALEYLARWLDAAGYSRLERDGVRFIHETDVANLVNHLTADVSLLRPRLEAFGDHVLDAEAYDATVRRLERALAEVQAALGDLRAAQGG